MKRVFIVHGWGGHPGENWFPWLKRELEDRGFAVSIPQLPDAEYPRIEPWVATLAAAVGDVDEDTYFVGHSLGCQTILRFLAQSVSAAGGAVFVAGFILPLKGLTPEEQETFAPWAASRIDLLRARQHLPQSFALFSDDDPWVHVENATEFAQHIGSKTTIEHKKGHYNEAGGFLELPIVLQEIVRMAT